MTDGFGISDADKDGRDPIEGNKAVDILRPDIRECDRRTLREGQVQAPIRRRGHR